MNKILLRVIFLFFLLPVGALDASNHNVLTIRGSNNSLSNVHVGDINLNRTNNIFNLITLGGNATVDKLNDMIRNRIFSSNRIPENALISYNQPKNKMFIIDKETGLITEVDCYLGSERLLGAVIDISSGDSKTNPTPPSPPANNRVYQPPSNSY